MPASPPTRLLGKQCALELAGAKGEVFGNFASYPLNICSFTLAVTGAFTPTWKLADAADEGFVFFPGAN